MVAALNRSTDLIENRNRWYDPSVGKWLSEDPIGFAGHDSNLNRYAANAVTTATDPTGLLWTVNIPGATNNINGVQGFQISYNFSIPVTDIPQQPTATQVWIMTDQWGFSMDRNGVWKRIVFGAGRLGPGGNIQNVNRRTESRVIDIMGRQIQKSDNMWTVSDTTSILGIPKACITVFMSVKSIGFNPVIQDRLIELTEASNKAWESFQPPAQNAILQARQPHGVLSELLIVFNKKECACLKDILPGRWFDLLPDSPQTFTLYDVGFNNNAGVPVMPFFPFPQLPGFPRFPVTGGLPNM